MKIDVDVSCFSEQEVWDILDGLLDARRTHVLSWLRERAEYVEQPAAHIYPYQSGEVKSEAT